VESHCPWPWLHWICLIALLCDGLSADLSADFQELVKDPRPVPTCLVQMNFLSCVFLVAWDMSHLLYHLLPVQRWDIGLFFSGHSTVGRHGFAVSSYVWLS
jgi:hypothetical protein